MKQATDFPNQRMNYELPQQDLRIDWWRLPALPRSRLVISNVRESRMPNWELTEHGLREEQRRIYRGSAAAFVVCGVVLGAAHVFLPRLIRFPGDDLQANLTFWAGATLFIVIWIMIGVGMVSRGRRHSAQDIRGSAYSAPSPRIAVPVAFLQNTLEQAVIAIFVQLALVLLLGVKALPLIAASVLLFALGRITFLAGYPKGAGARSFGMAVTALPSLTAFVAAAGALIYRIWQ